MDTLNGELGSTFLVSVLDAAILSWIALRWYRRSVLRLMRAPGSAAPAEDPATPATIPVPLAPGILTTEPAVPMRGDGLSRLPPGWRRLAAAYLAGAIAYSAIMTAAWIYELWPAVPAAIASSLWANSWPIVPVLALLLAMRWTQTVRTAFLFVLSGSALVALVTLATQIVRGSIDSAPLTNIVGANLLLANTFYAAAAVIVLTSWRRIRGVFAMTLAATLFFGVGLVVFRRVFLTMFGVGALRTAMLNLAAATTANVAYYGMYMVLAVPVGLVVWTVLRWLGRAYERKAFSDLQLVVDCWFAIVSMETMVTHLVAPYGLGGIAIGVAAFAAYRLTVDVVLRLVPAAVVAPERLLLLRVFGHQTRTEKLFDHLARQWRFRGPVQLIAGGDLAMRTVDPGDVLAFVSGRLRTQYVASAGEVPGRMERLDMQTDPDGRFRVNELYCLHDTWKATLRSLLAVTDRVVMDLRGFSRESRGCLYELQQIVAAIPGDRVVLIADQATDRPLLEDTLARAWAAAHPGTAVVRGIDLVTVERSTASELSDVLSRLTRRDGRQPADARGPDSGPPGPRLDRLPG